MKKLFLLLVTVLLGTMLLVSCKQIAGSIPEVITEDPPVIVHTDPPPEELPIEIEVDLSDVILALYDGSNLRLWNGTILVDAYVGHVRTAGNKKLAFEDVLYYFDDSGNSVYSQWLPVIPSKLIATESATLSRSLSRSLASPKSVVLYQDDVITIEDILPAEAYDLGARYEHYTRIFENNVEIGQWNLNEWECTDVIQTASGHILAINEHGAYINLTDDKVVETAYDGGIMTYNMGSQEGFIADETGEYAVTWVMNFFDNSRWLKADGVYYTESGYSWTPEGGVISEANVMYGWNDWDTYPEEYEVSYNERPYILPAGINYENGEECTYWIECNTGGLYRHIPSIDRLDKVIELYDGPDTRAGGIPYFNTLDPQVIDGKLYYHESGTIKTFDFTTGMVSVFSINQEVIEW